MKHLKNKLKEEILDKFGVNHFYKDFGATIKERVIYCKPEELIDWIDQKYISKEQILNLVEKSSLHLVTGSDLSPFRNDYTDKYRLIEEIKKL